MIDTTSTPTPSQELTGVVITHEDIDRAHDRGRVSATRAQRGLWSRTRLLWLLIGPGILVMLGENDGPSMLSYAATGARFGIGFFLPFVVLTFVMACVVQEMTVRLGAATHRGHAELIFDRFRSDRRSVRHRLLSSVRRSHLCYGLRRTGNDRPPRSRHASRPRRTHLRSLPI